MRLFRLSGRLLASFPAAMNIAVDATRDPNMDPKTGRPRRKNTKKPRRDGSSLAGYIDYTALKPQCTSAEMDRLCDEAMEYGFHSVCVNPCWVGYCSKRIREATENSPKKRPLVCTVIGFPLGCATTFSKCWEACDAVLNGAEELDMVANIGLVKEHDWNAVSEDIASVVRSAALTKGMMQSGLDRIEIERRLCSLIPSIVTQGLPVDEDAPRVCVKVILESCLLSSEELTECCASVVRAGAQFAKTSTGMSSGGATTEDVSLMRKCIDEDLLTMGMDEGSVKIKASGGIRDARQARAMIDAGAERLGTSAGVAIVGGNAAKSGSRPGY